MRLSFVNCDLDLGGYLLQDGIAGLIIEENFLFVCLSVTSITSINHTYLSQVHLSQVYLSQSIYHTTIYLNLSDVYLSD